MSEAKEEAEQGKAGPLRGVLPAGTTLRGYELISILGQGAFGITYRARDLTLGRDVAIKEYLPATLAVREGRTTVLPRSPDHAEQFAWGRDRFLDEARTLARLDRSAIVRVHDFLEDNGTAYMVMALVEGETLNKRLMRGQLLTPEMVERLLFPLLDGLEAVHAIGFLHRDIKPANIMVDDQGRPTLIDFGASRAAMAGRSTTMTAIFTPGYAAPEQFMTAGKLGPWSDIYGVAATLYHAITGRIPPSGIDRIVDDPYEPLSELRPEGFAPELLAGIDAGMATGTANRPQNIPAWRQALRSGSVDAEVTRIGRRPGRLARAARKTRKAGSSIRGPAVSGAVAAAMILLAGGGYLAFTGNVPTSGGSATLNLSTEQLEQVLAERRKADALVAEKRRLEEEARQKAETDAEAKRQADAQLEQARQALQKAEQELATLRTDAEARRQPASGPVSGQADQAAAAQRSEEEEAAERKAEAQAAALREAEEAAAKKAEAEAEAKRQADQALAMAEAQRKQAEAAARAKAEAEEAARRQASEEAQRKAEAEAASRRQADEAQAKAQAEREKAEAEAKIKAEAKAEADKAAAALAKLKEEGEAAERGLRLEQPERQRLQVALTSLGFDTRGNDGVFGPRSRDMIAGWQKKAGAPATGFLTAAQRDQLLRSAAPAVARWDEEQKKIEDEKKKADSTQAASTLNHSGSGASAPPASSSSGPGVAGAGSSKATALRDGTYGGGLGIYARALGLEIGMRNGSGTGTVTSSTCGTGPMSLTVDASGKVTGVMRVLSGSSCGWTSARITGRVEGGKLLLAISGDHIGYQPLGEATLTLGGASGVAAASPTLPSPDGLWRGTYACTAAIGSYRSDTPEFSISLEMRLANGSGTWKSANSSPENGMTVEVKVSVGPNGVSVDRVFYFSFQARRSGLLGQYDGNTIRATGRETTQGNRECTLALTRG
jgi:serine/threonine protein kinase/peptidoglycan hydrolase-like protein with peptidoglycan-binding domain